MTHRVSETCETTCKSRAPPFPVYTMKRGMRKSATCYGPFQAMMANFRVTLFFPSFDLAFFSEFMNFL